MFLLPLWMSRVFRHHWLPSQEKVGEGQVPQNVESRGTNINVSPPQKKKVSACCEYNGVTV